MKATLAILLVLIMSATAYALDSEIVIFDEAQSAFSRFDANEVEAWKQIDSQTAAFHEEWSKLNTLSRTRNRIAFLYKLKNKPDAIHWDNWKGWLRPIESSADSESLKETIPEFKELTVAFEIRKKRFTEHNDLLVRRNSFYDKNKSIFTKLEGNLSDELLALEKRMNNVRKSRVQQDAPPVPADR